MTPPTHTLSVAENELVGADVTRICFDRQTSILTDNGWELTISGGATWEPRGAEKHPLDLNEPLSFSHELLPLLWTPVVSCTLSEEHQFIRLTFEIGELGVQEQRKYEAWQLNGPRGEMVIATPTGGGGLAIWGPKDE